MILNRLQEISDPKQTLNVNFKGTVDNKSIKTNTKMITNQWGKPQTEYSFSKRIYMVVNKCYKSIIREFNREMGKYLIKQKQMQELCEKMFKLTNQEKKHIKTM